MTGVTCGAGTATTYGKRVFFSLFVYALRVSVSAIFRLYLGTNELFAILTVCVCLFLVCICFVLLFILLINTWYKNQYTILLLALSCCYVLKCVVYGDYIIENIRYVDLVKVNCLHQILVLNTVTLIIIWFMIKTNIIVNN
jgi:hypothetical protein